MKDIEILDDPIDVIRRRPTMYLGVDTPTAQVLAGRMVSSLVWLDALPAGVSHLGEWWVIRSERDWLSADGPSSLAAFSRILPLPGAGANSMRSEVLLTAFAECVVTAGTDGVSWIKGGGGALPNTLTPPVGGRWVAFTLKDD
jgi:hypothetical protein